jgi:hypothetical protein
MSDPLRVALVAEGITDYDVLNAAVASMLGERSFDLKLLQPEESVAFTGKGAAGPLGGGWKGVYKWCCQAVSRAGGKLRDDPLFFFYDMLIIHLDADVANENPAKDTDPQFAPLIGILPCEHPCPPPSATTNALRKVLLFWTGETQTPPKTVFCTPSKSTEAWIMAAFFPNDREMKKKGFECHPDPESRLAQQPIRERFYKTHDDYSSRSEEIQTKWPSIVKRITEAERFQADFTAVLLMGENRRGY